jgi:hypothetical protein
MQERALLENLRLQSSHIADAAGDMRKRLERKMFAVRAVRRAMGGIHLDHGDLSSGGFQLFEAPGVFLDFSRRRFLAIHERE